MGIWDYREQSEYAQMQYEFWALNVDNAIYRRFGVFLDELGDFDISPAFEDGVHASVYAKELGDLIEEEEGMAAVTQL